MGLTDCLRWWVSWPMTGPRNIKDLEIYPIENLGSKWNLDLTLVISAREQKTSVVLHRILSY